MMKTILLAVVLLVVIASIDACKDKRSKSFCTKRKNKGRCSRKWMKNNCAATCGQCPVDGGFSKWSAFGPCSKQCGTGTQTRTRSCTNPVPAKGGKPCQGATKENRKCNTRPCVPQANWSSWSAYGVCSKNCGGGTQTRTRSCTNPPPAHGAKPCQGPSSQSRVCNEMPCKVDGGFSEWSQFGQCSKQCGTGTQTRTRACTNPKPAFGGKQCQGSTTENRACNTRPCVPQAGWSSWSAYSTCSKNCGGGTQTRTRSCTNPAPAYGSKPCQGPSSQSQTCNVSPCTESCAEHKYDMDSDVFEYLVNKKDNDCAAVGNLYNNILQSNECAKDYVRLDKLGAKLDGFGCEAFKVLDNQGNCPAGTKVTRPMSNRNKCGNVCCKDFHFVDGYVDCACEFDHIAHDMYLRRKEEEENKHENDWWILKWHESRYM